MLINRENENSESCIVNKDKKSGKMNKFFTILLTLLVLLIPIAFLSGIISDRENYRSEAVNAVAKSWGSSQMLSAPEMYFIRTVNNKTEAVYLPLNNYQADIKINTEVRKKGIFKIPVYTADVLLKGDFINEYGNLSGKNLTVNFTVSDSVGFIEEPGFIINKSVIKNSHDTEVSLVINTEQKNIPFEISYKIRGLNSIYARVAGLNNKIKITGNWKDPSFDGNFLPSERDVSASGFSASWSVPRIAFSNVENANVGVSLLVPVDNYRMADRTLKYAFLFLTLTFLSYFIYEIIAKHNCKIHPLQYCLMGIAMLIFYLLLVSLSEFIPFLYAYIISAVMIISMIYMYTYFVITKKEDFRFSSIISIFMAIMYAFLYLLLTLQDLAMLAGSLGLFIVIAVIMYATKDIDWYSQD